MSNSTNNQINKQKNKKIVKYVITYTIISLVVFFFFILWQDSFSFLAIINSLYMVGIMYFVFAWFMIMNNQNLFSMIKYSFKALGSWVKGKKAEISYYDYYMSEKKIPKRVWLSSLLLSIPFIVIAAILNVIFVQMQ